LIICTTASYNEIVSIAISYGEKDRLHSEKKRKEMLEESSCDSAQRQRIVYQPIHHSLYHPPSQQVLQQAIVRPIVVLTYTHQPDTPGVRLKISQNYRCNVSKDRTVTKLGQVYYTRADVILEGELVMMGLFSIAKHPVVILFDSGASHTFINRAFAMKYQLPIEVVDNSFYI